MARAIHRTTYEYRKSINTPEFSTSDWLINPDLSGVDGVPQKYWKVVGDTVVEMDQAEKDAVDAANFSPDLPALDYAESETGTTSPNLQPKASLSPGVLNPNSKHRIEWYCEVNNDSVTGRTEVEIAYDGVVIGNPSTRARDRDDWTPFYGFQIISAGVDINTVTLKFRRLKRGTSKVRRARLTVTEVE